MIKTSTCEPDKCNACETAIPITQVAIGKKAKLIIRFCNECRIEMIKQLEAAGPEQYEETPIEAYERELGRDCEKCECARCSKKYCDDLDVCPDLDTCTDYVIGCGAFEEVKAND